MCTSSMVFWYDGAAGMVCCHAGQRSSPLASSPRTLVTQAHSELKLTQNSSSLRTQAHSKLKLTPNSSSLQTQAHSKLKLTPNSSSLQTQAHSKLKLTPNSSSLKLTQNSSSLRRLRYPMTQTLQYPLCQGLAGEIDLPASAEGLQLGTIVGHDDPLGLSP